MGLPLVLSGCVNPNKPDSPMFKLLAVPMGKILTYFAQFFGGSYGWAIIAITILVRIILLPLTMKQMRDTTAQSIRMRTFQPKIQEFQKRQQAATSQEEKMLIMQEQQAFFKENNIDMFGTMRGCLPLLIQLPIFSALYSAIRVSPEIRSEVFLGIPLGKISIVLAVITLILYGLQSWISLEAIPEEQRATMKWSLLSMPLMMSFITFKTPGGLTLYFAISALISIFQSLYTTYIFRPRIQAQVEADMAKNPVAASKRKDVTPTSPVPKPKSLPKVGNGPRRNEGKQNIK